MSINKLAQEVHQIARSKGFYEREKNIGEMLALIHSEVSEALEADRNGRSLEWEQLYLSQIMELPDPNFFIRFSKHVKGSFEDELADIVIRVLDLAAFKGIDLEGHIKAKVRYNKSRSHRHGKSY